MAGREVKVLVVVPTFGSPIYIALCDHFKNLLRPEELVIRSITGESDIQNERLIQALSQIRPTALIALDIRPKPTTVSAFQAAKIPIILFDEEAAGASSISVDNVAGGYIAGEYLLRKGKKNLAIVSGRTHIEGGYNAEQRLKGFLQALETKGITLPSEQRIEVVNYSREDGVVVMPKLLEFGVDAIFCAAGDNTATGLLSVARERGVRVPETVGIMGFDDLLVAQVSTPPMTTVRQPLKEMAESAYSMAVVHRSDILQIPQKKTFKPEIVERKSV